MQASKHFVAIGLFVAALSASAQNASLTVNVDNSQAPVIGFEIVPDFIQYPLNFGEILGVAVNSKGHIVVLNHPGSSTVGPLYNNATTQLLEFDAQGKFVGEIGKAVYGLGYGHSVRFDRHDNLWVVDKGTMSIMRFNPQGFVTMNLGRRAEGPDEPHRVEPDKAVAVDGLFNGPTDVGWDAEDNIYISDGYFNSRIAKLNSNGDWIKSWGSWGKEPGQFHTPHNLQVDRAGNVYVADRGNNRIQVFDGQGTLKRVMLLNAPYDKTRHPVFGNRNPNPPDATAPWTLCISTYGPTQYLFVSDNEPGRIYKMTLDGKILGMFGESGRGPRQFNWIHSLACPAPDTLFVADMNNWRVRKIMLQGAKQ
jgi:DNA-binding beta-propeller fold protein YncE